MMDAPRAYPARWADIYERFRDLTLLPRCGIILMQNDIAPLVSWCNRLVWSPLLYHRPRGFSMQNFPPPKGLFL